MENSIAVHAAQHVFSLVEIKSADSSNQERIQHDQE
jgi:hypothetical protein